MGLVTSKKTVGGMVSLVDGWERRVDSKRVLDFWRLAWLKRGSRNRRETKKSNGKREEAMDGGW